VDLDIAGEDGKRVRLGIICSGDERSEWLLHGGIEPSGSMELDAAILGTNDDLVVAGIDDERRPEWETCRVTANDLAFAELFEPFAGDSSRMIQGWMFEDSGRQFGDRLSRSAGGQFREVTLADRFEIGVDIGLLSQVFECVRIGDSQSETDFDVFEKIDPVQMKADIIPSGDFLAVDFVEQRGELLTDAVLHTAIDCRSADC
jgi:hypothetical protein